MNKLWLKNNKNLASQIFVILLTVSCSFSPPLQTISQGTNFIAEISAFIKTNRMHTHLNNGLTRSIKITIAQFPNGERHFVHHNYTYKLQKVWQTGNKIIALFEFVCKLTSTLVEPSSVTCVASFVYIHRRTLSQI